MTSEEKKAKLDLITTWLNGVTIAHVAHCKLSADYKQRGRMLGLIVTIISTIVGTSIFGAINLSNNQLVLAIAGLISVMAAILSGVNTFLNYSDLTSAHYDASKKYGKLRRQIEKIKACTNDSNSLDQAIKDIKAQWDALNEETPVIPERSYNAAQKLVNNPKAGHRWI